MNGKWDLTPLYQSFDDPAFAADLAALPALNEQAQALLLSDELLERKEEILK